MIRAFIGAVAVAAFVAATASIASSQTGRIDTGLDMNISGNAAGSVGSIQSCASLQPGDTLQIDFWVTGAPPPPSPGAAGGIAGFTYYLHFDPAVVKVTAVDNKFMLVDGGGNLTVDTVDANPGSGLEGLEGDPLPATTGNLRVESAEIGGPYESGDGVLSRITLQAIAAGSSELTLRDEQYDNYPAPSILEGATGNLLFVNSVQNSVVMVGGSCDQQPAPTPLDIGGLGGTIPGGATFPPASPGGDTGGSTSGQPTEPGQTAAPDESLGADSGPSVAFDVIPTGNEGNVIGKIETCARANKGDRFEVDLVIQDVKDLLAFEAAIKYDGEILDVVGSDTKLFLAGEGSNVNDTSAHTPDDSGRFVAGAVDLADPAEPDSGSGVLLRLTLEAKKDGNSPLSLKQADVNDDGKMDEGVLLRNVDAEIIGDANGDTYFDGLAGDAEIRVGKDCPDSNAKVVMAGGETGAANSEGGDGGFPWPIAGGVAAAVVVAAGAAFYVLRVRGRGSSGPGGGGATV